MRLIIIIYFWGVNNYFRSDVNLGIDQFSIQFFPNILKVYNNLKISELWLVSFDTVCKIVHLLLHAVCLCECHLFLISQGLFTFGIVTGSLVWETRGKQAVKCTINFYWLILKVLYRDWASFVSNTYTWVTDVMEILHYYKYYGKWETCINIVLVAAYFWHQNSRA